MKEETRTNKDNLIIGLLIQTQAEMQATRDTLIALIADTFKFNNQKIEIIEKMYKEKLKDCQMAIVGDIKANYVSKNHSINDMLNQIFPTDEDLLS